MSSDRLRAAIHLFAPYVVGWALGGLLVMLAFLVARWVPL